MNTQQTTFEPLPACAGSASFTCMAAGDYLNPKRWIAHDKNKHFAGEFEDEEEARAAVTAWNTKGGDMITLEWIAPPDDADDSNRGTYVIRLTGTAFVIRICSGWHSQELAGTRLKHLRNAVAKYGFETVSEVLFAAQTQWTEYGWTAAPPSRQNVQAVPARHELAPAPSSARFYP